MVMPELDERIRHIFDEPSPVTIDDVLARARLRRVSLLRGAGSRRRRAALLAAGACAVAAAVTAALLVTSTSHSKATIHVRGSGTATLPPVAVQLVLAETTVVAGTDIQGEIYVTNNTGKPIVLVPGIGQRPVTCKEGLPILVTIENGQVGPLVVIGGPVMCSAVLPTGQSRQPVSIDTDYPSCVVGDSPISHHGAPCTAKEDSPPRPPGIYSTVLSPAVKLPAGTQIPAAVKVTLLASPLSGPGAFKLQDIPVGEAVLEGRVGPGSPPSGSVPTMMLTFTNANGVQVSAEVINGLYQVYLPPGSWGVRAADSSVCATGISVPASGAWYRDDLVYPMSGCQDLAGPPST
jgi:hypothetical protein